MRATFEEKTYENYFNSDLDRHSEIFFPLGQVQEGYFGFDAGANTRNRRLWRRLGHPFWFFPDFPGASFQEIADEMEHILGIEIDHVPQMKLNVLLQYKKPEYIRSSLGAEWHLWNESYYRYDIYQEQQELLMHIHTSLGNKILIVYASPAIHDVNELVQIHRDRRIIEYSNFRKAHELHNHYRNTYIRSGTHSIACSDPEQLNNFDLINELKRLGDESDYKEKNNRQFIIAFRKQITAIMSNHPYYAESFKNLNNYVEDRISRYELFYSFYVMSNFRQLTGLQWLVKV